MHCVEHVLRFQKHIRCCPNSSKVQNNGSSGETHESHMQHMLKTHQKSIRKSNFFTVILYSIKRMIQYLQTTNYYPSKTAFITVQLTIGSEKDIFLVAS